MKLDAILREGEPPAGPAHDDPEPADFTVFPPDPGSCVEVQFAAHH